MILILGYDAYEQGTDPVITWLLHYGVPFVKVSLTDLLYHKVGYYVDVENRDVVLNGQSLKHTISTIWHRRFLGAAAGLTYPAGPHTEQLTFEVRTEVRDLVDYLHVLLKEKTWLTAFDKLKVNKLELLDVARQCGLRVPQTRVINNRRDASQFYHQLGGQVVSKPIADVRSSYQQDDCTYVVLTNSLDAARLAALPEYFFPTLFQERVVIDFEIRVFYLAGRFFATAMLTNRTERSVDKKLDNATAHAHYVPYQLPAALEQQLDALMRTIGLNTGSFDLLKTPQGEYVFLEVNPVGQYLAESNRCNYGLEREIAQWLTNPTYA